MFDCDGTLTDKREKLNKGVVELFYKILQNVKMLVLWFVLVTH